MTPWPNKRLVGFLLLRLLLFNVLQVGYISPIPMCGVSLFFYMLQVIIYLYCYCSEKKNMIWFHCILILSEYLLKKNPLPMG